MSSLYPTQRPTDADHLDPSGIDLPTDLLNTPWIDPHNHAQTLSWTDREQFATSGCRAMVMVASGHHWLPYRPASASDVRFLWDDAINRRLAIESNHLFEAGLALGIQTGVRLENPDDLLDAMDEYCRLDEVVAIGETGIRASQQVARWPLTDQQAVLEAQLALADRHGLPAILHTPSHLKRPDRPYRDGLGTPGYESNPGLRQDPVLTGEDVELEAVKLDVEAADEAGLADDRIVASHADPDTVPYLMEQTDCYVSFTLGNSWLTGVTAETVADTIDEYGPDRIMLETDAANVMRSDVRAIKRAILELYRLGIDEDAIREVVLENPRTVFDIGH